ncbi:MAG: thiamine-phosphate kinase [Pseudomonadota bacterium]
MTDSERSGSFFDEKFGENFDASDGEKSGEFDLIQRYFLNLGTSNADPRAARSHDIDASRRDRVTEGVENAISKKEAKVPEGGQEAHRKHSSIRLGNGDDAALLKLASGESVCVSIDTMVAGVHFLEDSDADLIAYRSLAAATSDLAAMGARPIGCLLALTLPCADQPWLASFRLGLEQATQILNIPLVGGDTTRGPLTVTVQVLGAVEESKALRRDGAKEGDALCVSGTLGDAAAGLAIVRGELEASVPDSRYLVDRFWKPRPAIALARQLRGMASAAIDLSDGLLADAGHIARASDLGLRIESSQLPLSPALTRSVSSEKATNWALCGGEDFELCFSLPSQLNLPEGCTRIGTFVSGSGVDCDFEVDRQGFQHF